MKIFTLVVSILNTPKQCAPSPEDEEDDVAEQPASVLEPGQKFPPDFWPKSQVFDLSTESDLVTKRYETQTNEWMNEWINKWIFGRISEVWPDLIVDQATCGSVPTLIRMLFSEQPKTVSGKHVLRPDCKILTTATFQKSDAGLRCGLYTTRREHNEEDEDGKKLYAAIWTSSVPGRRELRGHSRHSTLEPHSCQDRTV